MIGMKIYVSTSGYAIERDFLDSFAATAERIGHRVTRDSPRRCALSVVWGTRGHERIRSPKLYCEMGWLPRGGYQVSPTGINAEHHLAHPKLSSPSPGEAAATEAQLRALRNGSARYRYMDTTGPPAMHVPGAFILCPLQVETDTNMAHVPEPLRTAEGLIRALSEWNPPYPIIFKAHPSTFAHHEGLRAEREKDLLRTHAQGNVHGYLKHPGCQLVVTLNSNTAHDALIWDIPVVALGKGFWPRRGPFYPQLPPDLVSFWLWARSERTRLLRLAYARYVMGSQWSLDDASDDARVRGVVDLAVGRV